MYSGLGDSATKGSGDNTRVVALPTLGLTKEDGMDEDEEMPEVVASEATPAVITDVDVDEEMMIPALDLSTPSLITLTLLPKTQWKGLVNLDIIKVPLVLFTYSMWSLINLCCCLVSLFCPLASKLIMASTSLWFRGSEVDVVVLHFQGPMRRLV